MNCVESIPHLKWIMTPWWMSLSWPSLIVCGTLRDLQLIDLTVILVNLVNKDQLDILATLRESVNEDKSGLEEEVKRLKNQIQELGEKNRMQLEQVNGLLLDKVTMQSDGIGQREMALKRERDYGYRLASTHCHSSSLSCAATSRNLCRAKMYQKISNRVYFQCTRRQSSLKNSWRQIKKSLWKRKL